LLRFEGNSVNVKLNENSSGQGPGGGNRYEIVVDGKPAMVIVPRPGEGTYRLASNLRAGEHTVQVFRRTEAFVGVTQFLGFQLNSGGRALEPNRPKRRIEVIGDSISCGYGNEGKSRDEHFSAETENAYRTYGAIAARAVDAEYVCVAWSGKKLWPDNTITSVYDQALPGDQASTGDFSRPPADAVLINLGTNDFGTENPDEKAWTGAYKALISRIRKLYPGAVIYCASGPMISDFWPPNHKALSTINRYLSSIVSDLTKAGDTRVRLIEFGTQREANGIGSDWHPSTKTHELMAERWVKMLKEDLGW
jgi:lysophospholipase L1-like esterase